MDNGDVVMLRYALVKQLPSAYAICTNYGEVALDEEIRAAIVAAIDPILRRRLDVAYLAGRVGVVS